METTTTHTGKLWVIEQSRFVKGNKTILHEKAIRSPGVRIMAVNDGRLLLNKEYRQEHGSQIDNRLPGGSLTDDVTEWTKLKNADNSAVLELAKLAAVREAHEEAGLIVRPEDLELYAHDVNGGKSEWDLFYFHATKFGLDPDGPSFADTEEDEIIGYAFYGAEEVLDLARDNENGMKESRSARHVMNWALGQIAS